MTVSNIISSGLLESVALGVATEQEQLQVQDWINTYPEVRAEFSSIELAMEEYAFVHAIAPGSKIKDKVFASLNDNAKLQSPIEENDAVMAQKKEIAQFVQTPVRKMSVLRLVAAAAFALLIGSAVLNVIYYQKNKDSEDLLKLAQTDVAVLEGRVSSLSDDMSVVQNKYSVPVALNGLPAAPEAAAKIFWMKNTGDVYIDPSNLPAAPVGMQYQLWAIVDGKPVDGGMLTIETNVGNTYNIVKMKSFGKAEAFAVTLEKKGGSPQPEGEMFVMGKM